MLSIVPGLYCTAGGHPWAFLCMQRPHITTDTAWVYLAACLSISARHQILFWFSSTYFVSLYKDFIAACLVGYSDWFVFASGLLIGCAMLGGEEIEIFLPYKLSDRAAVHVMSLAQWESRGGLGPAVGRCRGPLSPGLPISKQANPGARI